MVNYGDASVMLAHAFACASFWTMFHVEHAGQTPAELRVSGIERELGCVGVILRESVPCSRRLRLASCCAIFDRIISALFERC